MGLKYVVKKRVFGFDKTRTEKYVAQHFITNTMNFKQLCNEVSKLGLIPEGTVKHVLDGMIDALVINLNKGISIQLGDFGCFRPGINCKSQDTAEAVDASTIQRVKIIFTPGYKFKEMLKNISIQKLEEDADSSGTGSGSEEEGGSDNDGESPDPIV